VNGAFLYQWVLVSEDRQDAINALNPTSLCRLWAYLIENVAAQDSAEQILALVIMEQSNRYVRENGEGLA